MTLVGHSIMGLSLGVAMMPKGNSRHAAGGFLLLMAAMACLPDWRIPFRSHLFSYNQHHSLLANCVIVACIGLAMASFGVLKTRRGWLVLGAVFAAAMSHLLLDSFYSHADGVNIGWPFGGLVLNNPIPWLHVQQYPFQLDWYGIRIRLMEFLTFVPLLVTAVGLRLVLSRRRSADPPVACR